MRLGAHFVVFLIVIAALVAIGLYVQKSPIFFERFADVDDADAAFKERMKLLEEQRDIDANAVTADTAAVATTPVGSEVYSFVASYCS